MYILIKEFEGVWED